MSGNRPPDPFFSIERGSDERGSEIERGGEPLAENAEHPARKSRLDEIVERSGEEASEKIQAILRLGAEWLGVENGHLAEIDPAAGTHTIAETSGEPSGEHSGERSGEHPPVDRGATADLPDTYCRHAIAEDSALAITDAAGQGFAEDRAYQACGLSTYFGA